MRTLKFYSLFLFMFISAGVVSYQAIQVVQQKPEWLTLFFYQSFTIIHCVIITGLGLGLPVILVAALLGWGQFALLMRGNINPHLGEQGLWGVLKTLIEKL